MKKILQKFLYFIFLYYICIKKNKQEYKPKKQTTMKTKKTNKQIKLNIGNGIIVTIEQIKRGGLKRFQESLLLGKYEIHTFRLLDMNDKKRFLELSNDKNSNRGMWYAHCNGYMFDAVITFRNEISINTYSTYRREKNL